MPAKRFHEHMDVTVFNYKMSLAILNNTSLTADIKWASMASFPGHLITSLSGNL